ncbi:hypothetical protein CC1G_09102 [Coprinopsis cinerea okayama7|uniref:Meiotic sister chromatid recombination protein 1 n=1 Tax=Coprinopsis cinerea (strain Okayama-7 / 130 / ATCC MYA-4618 / FGSC 9003) TaxID=240176 RepID=A8NJ48_COPC7|nr:hypothetical protein CC1G_09102 [Coprinopsis cinerea okayama7\|eukprot:XP_001834145.2 hypothetical protein CC1G_09102 [Coprinopsis cinerea okayama7\
MGEEESSSWHDVIRDIYKSQTTHSPSAQPNFPLDSYSFTTADETFETMRLTPIFVTLSLTLAAQASWFGGSNSDSTHTAALPYTTWTSKQLQDWLDVHNIALPKHAKTDSELRELVGDNWNKVSTWTYDQYASAQKAYADLRDTSFDKWDESRLRQFLLEQGVVAPKGPREKLVLMANERYRAYNNAASSFADGARATASSVVSGASEKAEQVTRSVASAAAQATRDVARAFDHSKDYIYSTWDDNMLRSWLVERGLIKSNEQKKKEELLEMVHNAWGKVANPIWDAWSNSYMHHWLAAHNIVKPETTQENRDYLIYQMKQYYYNTSDRFWHTWSDSQLKQWLVDHDVIKSDAQVSRDKMLKMVNDNWYSAKDTFWNAWTDNQLRQWLIDNGYMRSDAQKKRDELIKLAEEKYSDVNAKTAAYLAWPDARLRAYLREHGVSEDLVPGGRPGLLQETRIRWVQAENRADTVLEKIRELANDSAQKVEDVLARMLNILTTGYIDVRRSVHEDYDAAKEGYEDMKRRTDAEYQHAKRAGDAQYAHAKDQANRGYNQAKKAGQAQYEDAKARAADSEEWAEDKWGDAREYTGEKIKRAGEKVKGEL